MKTSNFLLIAATLLLNLNLFAQNGKGKTIVTSLAHNVNNTLVVDLNGTVDLKEWKEDYIRVVIYVTTNLQNENTLDVISASDRYFVDAKVDQYNIMKITNPFMNTMITVNGQPLQEQIRYEVFVPDYTMVHVLANDDTKLAVH